MFILCLTILTLTTMKIFKKKDFVIDLNNFVMVMPRHIFYSRKVNVPCDIERSVSKNGRSIIKVIDGNTYTLYHNFNLNKEEKNIKSIVVDDIDDITVNVPFNRKKYIYELYLAKA